MKSHLDQVAQPGLELLGLVSPPISPPKEPPCLATSVLTHTALLCLLVEVYGWMWELCEKLCSGEQGLRTDGLGLGVQDQPREQRKAHLKA